MFTTSLDSLVQKQKSRRKKERKQASKREDKKMKLALFITLLTFSCALSYNLRRNNRGYYEFFEDENSENNDVTEAPLPNIDFTENWEETVHGELGVGEKFRINYDGSRLKGPVSVEYKFNDGPKFKTESMGKPDSNGVYHTTISIPIDADKVVVWFKNEDNPPQYDSDYGKNYNFQITKPSIVFLEDWQEKQHGKLVPGKSFDLFYDSRRLKEGSQVEAQMKYVGDEVVGKTLVVSNDSPYQTSVISIPEDAEKLVMWFYYEDKGGIKHYDSDYGKNYSFKLS